MIPGKELELRPALEQVIDRYRGALADMSVGFDQAQQARRTLAQIIEGSDGYADMYIARVREAETKRLKEQAWRWVMARTGAENLLSPRRKKQFEDSLAKDELPDLTLEAALELLDLFRDNDLVGETLQEAFDALRPGMWSGNRYKTNRKSAWRIASKVILTWTVRRKYGGGYRVEYGQHEAQLNLIDRAFHLLDGKVEVFNRSYRSPLVDAINSTDLDGKGETPYFRFQCYGNGNLHLQIKRLDLLRELNRVGGEGRAEIGDGHG